MGQKCNVVDRDCLAPANAPGSTRAVCFRCGMPVCLNCSEVRPYGNYGRKRICNDCQEEISREKKRLGHHCPTVIFPFVGEVGTCVDCGKKWTRAEVLRRR